MLDLPRGIRCNSSEESCQDVLACDILRSYYHCHVRIRLGGQFTEYYRRSFISLFTSRLFICMQSGRFKSTFKRLDAIVDPIQVSCVSAFSVIRSSTRSILLRSVMSFPPRQSLGLFKRFKRRQWIIIPSCHSSNANRNSIFLKVFSEPF